MAGTPIQTGGKGGKYKIRPMRPQDNWQLQDLDDSTYGPGNSYRVPSYITEMGRANSTGNKPFGFVAEEKGDKGKIVGYVFGQIGQVAGTIYSAGVCPEYEGTQVANELVDAFEKKVWAAFPKRTATLQVGLLAQPFEVEMFELLGYEVVRRFTPEGKTVELAEMEHALNTVKRSKAVELVLGLLGRAIIGKGGSYIEDEPANPGSSP